MKKKTQIKQREQWILLSSQWSQHQRSAQSHVLITYCYTMLTVWPSGISCSRLPHTPTHTHSDSPQEVKVNFGVFGLDESPKAPKEVWSLQKSSNRCRECVAVTVKCVCVCVFAHQSKLVDLYVESLQLSGADLLRLLGEHLIRLQVNVKPVHLHLSAGVQNVIWLGHSWSQAVPVSSPANYNLRSQRASTNLQIHWSGCRCRRPGSCSWSIRSLWSGRGLRDKLEF